jgi:multiple sugar transport system permease protein
MSTTPLIATRRPRRGTGRRRARGLLRTLGLALTVIVAVTPFLYVLSVSFRRSATLYQYPPVWIPDQFTFANYRFAIDAYPLLRWLANTIGVALAVTTIKVAMDSMAAYALARMTFRGRGVVTGLMVCAILVPQACLIIPLFFLARDLGIFDTYWALILPPLASPLGVFILRAFIHALPPDFEQAARIDGCNAFQIYWRVILPLIRPGLAVVAIYIFVLQYSSFVWPLAGTQSQSLYMISVGLSTFSSAGGPVAAASVITTLVMTVLFVLFQRQFVGGLLLGALKG